MFSRLAARTVSQAQPLVCRPVALGVRMASSEPSKEPAAAPAKAPQTLVDPIDSVPRVFPLKTEGPERDLVNFPRPVQKEVMDPVRLGFIPEEWFDMFYKKTGVSGPYMFGTGLITWLISKEIYVLEHNFYNGITFVALVIVAHKKFGPAMAKWTEKEMEEWTKSVREFESGEKEEIQATIKQLEDYVSKLEVYKDIAEARRETAAAALEATYREWTQSAYTEAKKRLDYQLELANVERRIAQKNMSSWITENVLKSLSASQEQETLKKCVSDLKALSAAA